MALHVRGKDTCVGHIHGNRGFSVDWPVYRYAFGAATVRHTLACLWVMAEPQTIDQTACVGWYSRKAYLAWRRYTRTSQMRMMLPRNVREPHGMRMLHTFGTAPRPRDPLPVRMPHSPR